MIHERMDGLAGDNCGNDDPGDRLDAPYGVPGAPRPIEVSARGLCSVTGCGSEAEARELERQVAKLSRER